jgi:hypothetical protein
MVREGRRDAARSSWVPAASWGRQPVVVDPAGVDRASAVAGNQAAVRRLGSGTAWATGGVHVWAEVKPIGVPSNFAGRGIVADEFHTVSSSQRDADENIKN